MSATTIAAELYAADALALQPERLLLRLPYARDADDPGRTVMRDDDGDDVYIPKN